MGKRKLLKESQNKTSKELAKERLEIRRLQFKAEKLGFKNSDNKEELLSAYAGYREEKSAKKAGFIDKDGEADIKTYNKYILEQTAKNAGFIDEDGKVNVKAYDKYAKEKTAKNTRFIYNGKGDINAYKKHLREQKIKKIENDNCLNINYLDMEEESHLMSPFGDQKSLAFRRREDIMKLL
ncbi:hypothetical protein BA173_02010 [Rickettsia sp. MEAM1 (Bemisia tabaci)]|uniref:hypothetical protein n=3 Tax=unclassified Rickettsia TaxID=114295 RepID=UPI000BC08122|nr:hypothetical protein [Rickettsia sp. MEAM1 (Bemisia tabaci)]ASX27673.1 hypothetical protein BA173_02010 [Rickettsia sp. MEAM1 (Bemisia tabaci)]